MIDISHNLNSSDQSFDILNITVNSKVLGVTFNDLLKFNNNHKMYKHQTHYQ